MAIVGGCMTWGQEQHMHAGLQLCLLCQVPHHINLASNKMQAHTQSELDGKNRYKTLSTAAVQGQHGFTCTHCSLGKSI